MHQRQTVDGYISMLERQSLSSGGPILCRNDLIFQQENVAIHNSLRTNDFFMANKVIRFSRALLQSMMPAVQRTFSWRIT